MRGTKISIRLRWSSHHKGPGSPIPRGGKVSGFAGVKDTCKVANIPRTAFLRKSDAMCSAREIFPDQVTRWRRDMGWLCAAGAEAHLCALGHVAFFPAFMGSCARPNYSHQDASIPFAAVEKHFRRAARHDQKSQLGIGRHSGWITRLFRVAGGFHYFSEARLADSRHSSVQVGDPLGINPGRVGPQARSQAPVVARLSIARGTFLRFPGLKSSTNNWT